MLKILPGVFGLLAGAKSHQELPKGHRTVASGDLGQMAAQELALQEGGFEVGRWDVYATVPEADHRRALEYMWKRRTDGWWNLPLVKEGIITQEEFKVALHHQCKR
jgi:hypothetical protein